jgi:rhodanese-related sulfurtransferase
VTLDARGLPAGYPFQGEFEITPRQAKAGMADGSVVLVDCRTRQEWDTARIQGAKHIPLDEFQSRLSELEALGDEARVAIHCHHGVRSLKAAIFLRQQGVDAVSVAGGIDLWSQDVDPTVPRYER